MARIRAPEYLACPEIFEDDGFPVDVLISPEQILTNHIIRLVEHPGALQVLDFAGGRIQLAAVRAYEGGPLVHHPLSEMRDLMPNVDVRVAAIYRGDHVITPRADTVIEPEDEVFFVAARENINDVMSKMRNVDKSVNRIMLAGGGNIGFRLATNLEGKGYPVKIIEHNAKCAESVADRLNDTVVLLGDAADEDLLRQENIDNMDVFCAVTNNDEANILSAMLAKNLGARRVMALINRSVYVRTVRAQRTGHRHLAPPCHGRQHPGAHPPRRRGRGSHRSDGGGQRRSRPSPTVTGTRPRSWGAGSAICRCRRARASAPYFAGTKC